MSEHRTTPAMPLRQRLNIVAFVVALATAVTVPAGYFLVGYRTTTQFLDYRAQLNAAAVARYAELQEGLWKKHAVQLQATLQTLRTGFEPVRSTVRSSDGEIILESGVRAAAPVATRTASIVVAGRPIGQVESEISIRTLLVSSAVVALFSSLLGLGIYFAVRIFPMRLLDRTIGKLEATNRLFDAAIDHMSQGLCMFDGDFRLSVSNRRYAEMYGLDPTTVRPGLSLSELLAMRVAAGTHFGHQYSAMASQGEVEASNLEVELNDGRIFHVVRTPLKNGGWVGTHEDITAQKLAQERIEFLAHHDALTGLPNRTEFRRQLEKSLKAMARGSTVAVLCLDLDHFKAVNDTLGHPVGDILLQQLAHRLRGCMRDSDFLSRLGGDEFAIIVSETGNPLNETTALSTRLIEAVGSPFVIDEHHLDVGLSVGIAIAPNDGDNADELLKAADLALYRAKSDGRGTYRFFEAEMDAQAQARRRLELDLRMGLGKGEFELYYQPIVAMESEEVVAFEALVRWRHPTRGVLSPAEFIGVAEETSLIVPLGEWILRKACADAVTWSRPVHVAVNLSAVQFRSRRLLESVFSAVAASGLAPGRLELEITESVLLQNNAGTLDMLHRLRDFGVRISMDDFGTGYSSLSYLRSFPFDKIKIDGSFVKEIGDRPEAMAIIRAVAGLGTTLGIATTAEGVETTEQVDLLRREGCTEMQGYAFSRPRPASEVEGLLNRSRAQARAIA